MFLITFKIELFLSLWFPTFFWTIFTVPLVPGTA